MKWVLKTSAVRVSDSQGDQVYHSLEEVPASLREKIRETLEGPNAETVLIANQEAYDQIIRKIRDLPPAMQPWKAAAEAAAEAAKKPRTLDWRLALAGILSALVAMWVFWIWLIEAGRS